MHRFYIAPDEWNAGALRLTNSEAHHARDVLRLSVGDEIVVFDGRGLEITAAINSLGKDEIVLRKLHERLAPPLPCRITLAQAIPKGKNMELIVQKAVEIGVAEIVPLVTERTIVQPGNKAAQKQAKWQSVAIEAAKQCGQNWLPRVRPPAPLQDFLPSLVPNERDLRLIGSLQSDAVHLKKILASFAATHEGERPQRVVIFIGPEGDFTPDEISLARSHDCEPLSLGRIVLRVETAAIYCLSILAYELL